MANKLELTWVGKEERIEVEPRILIEVPDKSFSESADDLLTAATFDNMLIHGDNLLARNLGVSFATVNRWENGKTKPSRLAQDKIRQVANMKACKE